MSEYTCPSCGSVHLEATQDFMRDLTLVRCRDCGECYCTTNKDLYNLGADVIIAEWHKSFSAQKRIEGAVSA